MCVRLVASNDLLPPREPRPQTWLYCYEPHVKKVRDLLGTFNIMGVDEHTIERIRGLEDIHFYVLASDPKGAPQEMLAELMAHGAVIFTVHDYRRCKGVH